MMPQIPGLVTPQMGVGQTIMTIISGMCSTVISTICCALLCGVVLVYLFSSFMCDSWISPIIFMALPIILDIIGAVVAVTGVGLVFTAPALVVSTALEVVAVVCDVFNGMYLDAILGCAGWIPIVGILPQSFRVIWKIIT